ncbi:MAG: hypothetical protein ACE10D_10180 [Planctomycetota bacterium]
MTAALLLLLAAPVFDTFEAPLDPDRWYIGVAAAPKKGAVRIPKNGWLASRGLPDKGVQKIEIVFRHRGGGLEVSFHTRKEPLSMPVGTRIFIPKGKGTRTLVVDGGATLDGEPLQWKGTPTGTFRLTAVKGDVEIEEVRVHPNDYEPPEWSSIDKDTVHLRTTPLVFAHEGADYSRVSLPLWDVEVSFLFRRGETSFEPLRAPVKKAPVLGALVQIGDGKALAVAAARNPIAMRDWGDERTNLSKRAFDHYLSKRYAEFEVLMQAQRALNAALPEGKRRKAAEALVYLAVIRHTDSAAAAVALVEDQGAKMALRALKEAVGKGRDYRRMKGDQLRLAAGRAARAILWEAPEEWPGFQFDPTSRYVTMSRAEELVR